MLQYAVRRIVMQRPHLYIHCLTCGWVGLRHFVFWPHWPEAKRHFLAEHRGMWERPPQDGLYVVGGGTQTTEEAGA
jgi:hypothetical protein